MKRKPWRFSLICFVIGTALVPKTVGLDDVEAAGNQKTPGQVRWKDDPGEILIFIHSADLMCFNCLEGILNFIQMLPRNTQQEHVLGVLIDMPSAGTSSSLTASRIQLKKIHGFIKAHDLYFRVVVDSGVVFSSIVSEGSSIVAIDRSRGVCTRYDFPLSPVEKREVMSVLGL